MGANRREGMAKQQLLPVTVLLMPLLLTLARIECTHAEKKVAVDPALIQIDLMHSYHEKSPSANPKLSLTDRVRRAVANSKARTEYFNSRISKSGKYSSTVFSAPLSSNQGDYVMKVGLGTPAQSFVAIADTGSDLFWLQCNCVSCYSQPDPYFAYKSSSTFSPMRCTSHLCSQLPSYACTSNGQCHYGYSYGDRSSTQGILSSDVIALGGSSFTVDFGCGEANKGTFNGADGLVGLGRGPLSIISQIGITVFSYCLVSYASSSSKTSPLVFGDTGGSYLYTGLVFNPAADTFYYVDLQGVSVNGTPLSIPSGTFSLDSSGNGGFILDSGTTITQLQQAAYTPLRDKLKSLISYTEVDGSKVGLDLCYTPGLSNPSWPRVTFQFQSVDVQLPGENLFLLVSSRGEYCLAIQASGGSFGIYGNIQQQNFNIKYDIGNSRVGFSPSTC